MNIYCEIHPFNNIPKLSPNLKGVILSGSPFSMKENAPIPDLKEIKDCLLGVCYGAQYLAHKFGGEVLPSKIREYGRANLSFVDNSNPLMKDVPNGSQVWMSLEIQSQNFPMGIKQSLQLMMLKLLVIK